MGLFDVFRPKKKPRQTVFRKYAAASTSRLFADAFGGSGSADSEIRQALEQLRNRSATLSAITSISAAICICYAPMSSVRTAFAFRFAL